MHEMSIAIEIIEQLEAIAAEHGLERIDVLTVRAGAMRAVVPDALEMAFEAAAEGTCAQGARLTLEVAPIVAECRECGMRFEPKANAFLCAQCNRADVAIVEGDEILLMSVSGRERDGEK